MNRNTMNVICISERKDYKQVEKGKRYLIDRLSVWIDSDGDAYGMIFDLNHNYVGQMKLSHFMTL